MEMDPEVHAELSRISTGTITTILFKHGLRSIWMDGPRHLFGTKSRLVGPAFTMRFVAGREDLTTSAAWSSPKSTRACIEQMPEGCVVVADAGANSKAGIVGDILCARMQARGVQGLLVDGAVRDAIGIRSLDFDIWANGISSPPAVSSLHFVGWQEPISCGGVAIIPDDIIVADEDGAVVIPKDVVGHVLKDGVEQENLESWILEEVRSGNALSGLYPINDENRQRYERAVGKSR
jgi:regulator of RNase E activity RraA